MISEANQIVTAGSGLSFILGTRIPYVPDVVTRWRDAHPGQDIPDGQVFTQPWPATSTEKARGIPDRVIYYQYRHDRARRTLRGIDDTVAKAEKAVDGHASVKPNRFIKLTGARRASTVTWRPKPAALAGSRATPPTSPARARSSSSAPTTSCGASRRAPRCPARLLQARPIYHHKRESIKAHLSIVFAALAVSHWIEHQTGRSIKKFVQSLRRYRTCHPRRKPHLYSPRTR